MLQSVKRLSIQAKLMLALGVLSVCVTLLVGSCMVSLHRYQDYSEVIREGSDQFQEAHQLYQTALDLKATKERIHSFNQKEMLTSNPLPDPLLNLTDYESNIYAYLVSSFEDQLSRYREQLQESQSQNLDGVAERSYQSQLDGVEEAFEELLRSEREIPHDPADFYAMMQRRHETLVIATDEHLKATKQSIDQYSASTRKSSRKLLNMAIICGVIAIALSLTLLLGFFSLVVKPFKTLIGGARLVAGGHRNHRIYLGTEDELDELAAVLNEMTSGFQAKMEELRSINDNLDREVRARTVEAIQNEQLASVGFLAAGVAHEINNPLAAIAWSAESLQSRIAEPPFSQGHDDFDPEDTRSTLAGNLQVIEEEAYRCKAITEKLLEFSRPGNNKRVKTNLVTLVEDVVQIVSKVSDYRSTPISVVANEEVIASINPQEIRQVVLNLLTNALQSLDGSGSVRIDVTKSAENSTIRVVDNGCGMSPEVKRNLFEPFFTQRRNGGGTGLGLSISRRIVMQHGGSLQAHSGGEGTGSTLELSLPNTNQADLKERLEKNKQGLENERVTAA